MIPETVQILFVQVISIFAVYKAIQYVKAIKLILIDKSLENLNDLIITF